MKRNVLDEERTVQLISSKNSKKHKKYKKSVKTGRMCESFVMVGMVK